MVTNNDLPICPAHFCIDVSWVKSFLHLLFIFNRTQSFNASSLTETLRSAFLFVSPFFLTQVLTVDFFLILMFIFVIDVLVRSFGLGWRSFRANGWNLFDMVVATGSFVTTFIVRFGASGYGVQQLQKLFLVSIAFKLVQRTNSLNMLFKTAVYVLTSPLFTAIDFMNLP